MKKRIALVSASLIAACLGLLVVTRPVAGGGSLYGAPEAPAAALHVCPSGCAYDSIQAAVSAAQPGDVVKVAQGIYTDVHTIPGLSTGTFTATQVVAITKSVTLQGGYAVTDWSVPRPDTQPTILDAGGAGRVLVIIGSGVSPRVEGLRLTGGNASGLGGSVYDFDAGGGLYVLGGSAVISNNVMYGNTAYRAAGAWLQNCTVTFQSNEVRDNVASYAGGGMWLYGSPATLRHNRIVSNAAVFAGGITLHLSDATLTQNDILSNTATSSEGGGVTLINSGAALESNLITANKAVHTGGGLFLHASDARMTNNVIADNYADRQGSGIYVGGSSPRLIHNSIARNGGDGGGVYVTTSTVGMPSHVVMTNTIVSGHTEGIIADQNNTVTLHSTLWHGNGTDWLGHGTVNRTQDYVGDPAFAPDGYHITIGSAALDRGTDTLVTSDVDGESRLLDRPDLGADELIVRRVYLPLVACGFQEALVVRR